MSKKTDSGLDDFNTEADSDEFPYTDEDLTKQGKKNRAAKRRDVERHLEKQRLKRQLNDFDLDEDFDEEF